METGPSSSDTVRPSGTEPPTSVLSATELPVTVPSNTIEGGPSPAPDVPPLGPDDLEFDLPLTYGGPSS
jgi:hypothetical protein